MVPMAKNAATKDIQFSLLRWRIFSEESQTFSQQHHQQAPTIRHTSDEIGSEIEEAGKHLVQSTFAKQLQCIANMFLTCLSKPSQISW